MFCKSTCSASDHATDSVKVDPAAIVRERQEAERAARAQQEALETAEQERRLQNEAERARLEEERQRQEELQLQEEQARARREEEERAQREQERARREQEEKARLELEEQVRREQERVRLEKEEQAQRREVEERQEALSQFYARNGFTGINDPRRSGCAVLRAVTTYPLHCAAEAGDERVVSMLLKEGAATLQKDSSGRTAAQVAQRKNKGGSHEGVLRALGVPAAKPRVGGA
mmetsp:Transcript_82703/g.192153  ORF Transcript_82703/g.192153 Transcript_82703/m.192153 type:complete len:233 (-) Transcript_82703:102-800(-)